MKKLMLLAALAVVAFAGLRVPFGATPASADPHESFFDVTLAECAKAGGGTIPGCNGDGKIDNNEPVSTSVTVKLFAGGSFLDSSVTESVGVQMQGGVPDGDAVGTGNFKIGLVGPGPGSAPPPCGPSANLGPVNFTIYDGLVNPGGSTPGGTWSWPPSTMAWPDANWIQDFDDDNNNGIPDGTGSDAGYVPPADPNVIAESIEDAGEGAPIPIAGAFKEPVYLPMLDAIVGDARDFRGIGNAVVIPDAAETPVDFITYQDYLGTGVNLVYAVIGSGAALGLYDPNPATAGNTVTCPHFETTVTTNAGSSSGAVVQKAVGAPGTVNYHRYRFSVAEDFDGDGVPGYNDTCDTDPTITTSDPDGDGVDGPCDLNPSVKNLDEDGDGFRNWADNCPATANATQTDGDLDGVGDACDPAPAIAGAGLGYGYPAGGLFHDHDQIWIDRWTIGLAEGAAGAWAYTQALGVCENENAASCAGLTKSYDSVRDSDIDGRPDFVWDLDGDGNLEEFDTSDSDGDGFTDGCETGRLILNMSGSDALDPTSTPGGGAVAGDCDNDGTPDSSDSTPLGAITVTDSDGDKCSNASELARSPKTGDPYDPFDFYSVPVPALLLGAPSQADGGIGVTTDVTALLKYSGKGIGNADYDKDVDKNGVPDGFQYDRSAGSKYGGSWPGAPDGAIGVTTDLTAMLAQSGFTCS